ncbi:MAG: helix-turn-helix domain-containing protein [Erysipelotrichaceae bacterium]
MEIGKQIRNYRMSFNMSQEELCEKIYVSRQTLSSWENDKSYPDINSLVMMSEIFGVSLDELVKPDIVSIKQEIDSDEYKEFLKNTNVFGVLFILLIILPVPLMKLLRWYGVIIYICIFVISMYYGIKIEKYKKKHDIETYKEIVSFMEGKNLNMIEKAREEGKRPYQNVAKFIATGILVIIVSIVVSVFV